jgi:hypothetical protein
MHRHVPVDVTASGRDRLAVHAKRANLSPAKNMTCQLHKVFRAHKRDDGKSASPERPGPPLEGRMNLARVERSERRMHDHCSVTTVPWGP